MNFDSVLFMKNKINEMFNAIQFINCDYHIFTIFSLTEMSTGTMKGRHDVAVFFKVSSFTRFPLNLLINMSPSVRLNWTCHP